MTRDRQSQLHQMGRIARAKADLELRRYAAHRAQADAMQRHVDDVRHELTEAIASPCGTDADRWRLTVAMVGYRAEAAHRAEQALRLMRPSLDAARASAAAAFGRAEAIAQLKQMAADEARARKLRRSD